jgi:hypothetical protein
MYVNNCILNPNGLVQYYTQGIRNQPTITNRTKEYCNIPPRGPHNGLKYWIAATTNVLWNSTMSMKKKLNRLIQHNLSLDQKLSIQNRRNSNLYTYSLFPGSELTGVHQLVLGWCLNLRNIFFIFENKF